MEGNKKGFLNSCSELNHIYQDPDSDIIINFCLFTENYHYLGNLKIWKPVEDYNACV